MNNPGKPASFTDIAFDSGVIYENSRLLQWLLDHDIVREDMFGSGYVAVATDGQTVVEFKKLGAEE